MTSGIGPVPVSVSVLVLGFAKSRNCWSKRTRRTSDRRQASHLNVVLSKTALSARLCVCEREPPAHFPYWIQAEEKEGQGLWDKGVFKKWSRKDLPSNDRVFTSRYVYKLKRSAVTGEVYRFKARLIVRGFQMEKGVDFDDSFSPTPGLAVGRFMLSHQSGAPRERQDRPSERDKTDLEQSIENTRRAVRLCLSSP